MPKKFLRRLIPHPDVLLRYKSLRLFGPLIHQPALWALNRRSVARAFAVALFCGWLPVPGHTFFAIALAIPVRANVPLSMILVWFSNPFTMPVLFYIAYRFGVWILQLPLAPFHFELSIAWLEAEFLTLWKPLLLGSLVIGLSSALLVYGLIQKIWTYQILHHWKKRHFKP